MKHIRFINLLFVPLLIFVLLSCNRDEIFEREQYKAVVALLSDDGFNIFSEELEFSDGVDGYIAASCGGVLPTTEPIDISIVEDVSLIGRYNISNFDTDAERYALYLSSDRYQIEKHSITIPTGERMGRMHIRLRTTGLSPDSVYFIPFRVNNFSAYEFNPKKSTVLYRLYLKNFYASTKDGDGATIYNQRGKRGITNTMVQKKVFPTGSNEVRIMAGIKEFQKEEELIDRWSIRLIVGEDDKVTILPWNTSDYGMKLTQIDGNPDFPNTFSIVNDGYNTYKTFLLRYNYVDPDDGNTYEMSEELRLQFSERDEY
ncbi:BT_3044 domain-containing protein [Proteiniphilum sp.]|nr:DUF4361 domain-containing protein [Proteiniphilum sp.]MEA4918197.1 DUF4361 domain-containing protein [Proteiniphilum sp.]